MNPDQQATIEMIECYLQKAIDTFSEPHLATVEGINAALEHLVKAQLVLDSIVLQNGTPSAKKEVVYRMIRDIALRESDGQSPTLH